MGATNPKEMRSFSRYHVVSSACNGRLSDAAGASLAGRIIDVGRDGLGILMQNEIKEGSVVNLEIEGRSIAFSVVYCVADLIHSGAFRCGLHRRAGSSENLVNLFTAAGWIES